MEHCTTRCIGMLPQDQSKLAESSCIHIYAHHVGSIALVSHALKDVSRLGKRDYKLALKHLRLQWHPDNALNIVLANDRWRLFFGEAASGPVERELVAQSGRCASWYELLKGFLVRLRALPPAAASVDCTTLSLRATLLFRVSRKPVV